MDLSEQSNILPSLCSSAVFLSSPSVSRPLMEGSRGMHIGAHYVVNLEFGVPNGRPRSSPSLSILQIPESRIACISFWSTVFLFSFSFFFPLFFFLTIRLKPKPKPITRLKIFHRERCCLGSIWRWISQSTPTSRQLLTPMTTRARISTASTAMQPRTTATAAPQPRWSTCPLFPRMWRMRRLWTV